MARSALALLVIAGCGASPPAVKPATAIPAPTADAAVSDAPVALQPATVLSDTPAHRELHWLIEVIGHRHGRIDAAEVGEHWGAAMARPMPAKQTIDEFQRWGEGLPEGVIETIEVDDPTYIVAHVVFGAKRWRVVVSLDPNTMKINLVRNDPEP